MLSALNLTALLALAALGDLVLYRIVCGVFLPSRQGSPAERWVAGIAVFISNFSALLGLLLAAVALVHGLRSDRVFPRSMRITVSTIGLFFCVLAALDVLAILAPRYQVHMRISHGFLAFFLATGVWHGLRPIRAKAAVTLFAIPILLQAAALFVHRMGHVGRIDAGDLLRASHAVAFAAMIATPALLMGPLKGFSRLIATTTGIVVASALGTAAVLRFDLVQAIAFYGFRFDLTGLTTGSERIYTGALVLGVAGVCATAVGSMLRRGAAALVGWGILLIAATGMDVDSAKLALFSLCGLLALAAASAETTLSPPAPDLMPEA